MRKHHLAILLSVIALSACDSGSDDPAAPEPTVLTGEFIDSAVEGLFYQTETQSGLTDESGHFSYLEGEVVTFFLGNTELGRALGSDLLTPFEIAGHRALDSEVDILKSLTSSSVNSYDKALNIATLLQSFDEDLNPENGIDLNTSHEQLAEITIPIYVKASSFAQSEGLNQAKSIMNIESDRSFTNVVNHLYSSLNIDIISTKVATQLNKQNNSTAETIDYQYDTQGNVSSIVTDTNSDGQTDNSLSFSYDEQGQLIGIENSANQSIEALHYDDNDNLVSRSRSSSDGSLDSEETFSYQDKKLERFELNNNVNSTESITTEFSYNEQGNLGSYTIDSNGDDIVDNAASLTYSRNKVIKYSEDHNNDGEANIAISYSYDTKGNRVTQNIQTNDNTDTPYTSSRFSYDDNNNPTRYELDKNLDGEPEYIEVYKYNSDNNRTLYKIDNNADGIWDFMAQYDYDANGNRIRMIEDSNGNGIVDKIWQADYVAAVFDNSWDTIIDQL
jgi:YD repeat-containing protein